MKKIFKPMPKKTISNGLRAISFLIPAFLINVSAVNALPLDVSGDVNPFAGTVIDGGATTTFGQVDYRFNVVAGDFGINFLNLEFEDDVFFSAVNLSVTTVGWNGIEDSHNDRHVHLSGTTIPIGEQLEFSISGLEVATPALDDVTFWDAGGTWKQAWRALYLDPSNPLGFSSDGGATVLVSAPVSVPEPSSFALLTLGALGFVVTSTRRRKRN